MLKLDKWEEDILESVEDGEWESKGDLDDILTPNLFKPLKHYL